MTPHAQSQPQNIPRGNGGPLSPHRQKQRRARVVRTVAEDEVLRLAARVRVLERRQEGLRRFAAVAAHELVTPLVIAEACRVSIIRRLAESLDPESLAELDALSSNLARTRVLVEALLQDARSADRPLERQSVDMHAVVSDSVELLRAVIDEKRARVVMVRPLPVVQGDRSLLRVVVHNLLSNALQYGPPLDGVIRVMGSRARGCWRISMTSQGDPLDHDDLMRIFDPFERGRRAQGMPGTGLGLAICRGIVERHGGKLGVEPLRAANRFHFTIPA